MIEPGSAHDNAESGSDGKLATARLRRCLWVKSCKAVQTCTWSRGSMSDESNYFTRLTVLCSRLPQGDVRRRASWRPRSGLLRNGCSTERRHGANVDCQPCDLRGEVRETKATVWPTRLGTPSSERTLCESKLLVRVSRHEQAEKPSKTLT